LVTIKTTNKKGLIVMQEDYNPDIVAVIDEDGTEHTFEVLDSLEDDGGRYVALLPVYDDSTDILEDDGELIILKVVEENGEDIMATIEDEREFDRVASYFEESLADSFEIEPIEQ